MGATTQEAWAAALSQLKEEFDSRLRSQGTEVLTQFRSEFQAQLDLLRGEIAARQTHATPATPWRRRPELWISIAAFVLSLASTAVSNIRQHRQDIISAQMQLSTIIQHLNQIPQQYAEVQAKYAGQPDVQSSLLSEIYADNTATAKRASQIIAQLKEDVTPTELYSVADAFCNAGLLKECRDFATKAITRATDFNDLVGALRLSANVSFALQDEEGGRALFKRALKASEKFEVAEVYVLGNNFRTNLIWAAAEAQRGLFSNAESRLDEAEATLQQLPPQMAPAARAQLDDLRSKLEQLRHKAQAPPATRSGLSRQ